MNYYLSFFLVALTLGVSVIHGLKLSDHDELECSSDPCNNATCPRHLNARCVVVNSSGICTAEFRHFKHNHLITRCSVKTCEQKKCRVCVSEPVPSMCRNGPGTCRQSLKAVCKHPPPPTSCQAIVCPEGKECVMGRRRLVAKCRVRRPSSCEELTCEEGMVCITKKRKNGNLVAKCLSGAETTTQIPFILNNKVN